MQYGVLAEIVNFHPAVARRAIKCRPCGPELCRLCRARPVHNQVSRALFGVRAVVPMAQCLLLKFFQ
jgi:hypothetical protein